MKVVSVVGARPQFIKAAPLSAALEAAGCQEVLGHTGQHYDYEMSGLFFEELGIRRPDVDLGVGSDSHGRQTARMLEGIEAVVEQERPDWVLVYGDTNSTLAGALAAVKLHVPVAHVEAGLWSNNRRMPEEINRIVTDHVSDALFCPTATAVENLRREGVDQARIHLVGDVMYDAAMMFAGRAAQRSRILEGLGIRAREYVLATIHRAENADDPMRLSTIFRALDRIAEAETVIVPLHPRTLAALRRFGLIDRVSDRVRLIDPVGYLDMIMLEQNARIIATDSGGVQKEAYFFGVPCVTLRYETEWIELVETGWNRLVPPVDEHEIVRAIEEAGVPSTDRRPGFYGDGDAAQLIAKQLLR